jgi:hypothetical protein
MKKVLVGLYETAPIMPCRAVPCRAVPFVTFFCVLGKKFLCHGAGWGSVLF